MDARPIACRKSNVNATHFWLAALQEEDGVAFCQPPLCEIINACNSEQTVAICAQKRDKIEKVEISPEPKKRGD
jgi:hypothetical protein